MLLESCAPTLHREAQSVAVADPFQVVSGAAFEVHRRMYVDFDGINLRRKFLTGLEPETITMTIGNMTFNLPFPVSSLGWDFPEILVFCRFTADPKTRRFVRIVFQRSDAVSCGLSVRSSRLCSAFFFETQCFIQKDEKIRFLLCCCEG